MCDDEVALLYAIANASLRAAVCVLATLGCSSSESVGPSTDAIATTAAPRAAEPVPSPSLAPAPTVGDAPAAEPTPPAATEIAPATLHAVRLFAGAGSACAEMSTGKLRCWGWGKATPYEVTVPANVVQLELLHALDRDGRMWRRSDDAWARLDDREHVRHFDERDGEHLVTVHDDGSVRVGGPGAWGASSESTVLAGITAPVQVVSATYVMMFHIGEGSAGADRGCARAVDGSVRCWDGKLKVFDTKLSGSAVVDAFLVCALDPEHVRCALPYERYMQQPQIVPGLDGALAIAGGTTHDGGRVCGVFDDGSVACAELTGPAFSDPKIGAAKKIADLPPTDEVAVGEDAVYVRLRSGGVMAWGINDLAQLGDDSWIDRATPVPVANLLDDPLPPASDGGGREQDVPTDMDWSDLPPACAHVDELVLGENRMPLVSAYAWHEGESVRVRLASFRQPRVTGFLIRRLRGRQQMLHLGLHHRNKDKERALSPGRYTHDDARRSFWMTSERRAVAKKEFEDAGDAFQITQLTKQWLCGTLTLEGRAEPMAIAARVIDDD